MSWSLDRRAEQEHPELLDVRNREHLWVTGRTLHRVLDGHLPVGEQVHELLVGAVGDARAVLAVTDTRAVLAAEPRGSAPARCADLPLTAVTAVEWTRHGPTGCLVLRTAHACHVLRHVELRHGPEVAERVRERWLAVRPAVAAHEPVSA
ncbi:hypothetical protein FHN55_06225 [Streptomyces sp. NP160]|uniref:hypothetical protein n=1 Tax=Streptomyces sp. NP160 TaxID=2586637 RepID=UPI00111BB7D1|nr:hypothetical protein [Streptomyces sp. NP160]TNM68414.1 hypothetical protein FHN55_06225 [Streptomyces sp. NP160]